MINNTLKYIPHLPRSRIGSESIHDPHEGYLSSESIHFTNLLFEVIERNFVIINLLASM